MRRVCLALALALLAPLAAGLGGVPRSGAAQGTPVPGAGATVAGPGLALLPAAADGGPTVVAAGRVGEHLAVLLRNGGDEPAELAVVAAGLDAAGERVWMAEASTSATGWSGGRYDEGVQPRVVPAGGVAMAVLPLPAGAPTETSIAYRATASPLSDADAFFGEDPQDLRITAARADGDRLVVEVQNAGVSARDSAGLVAFCLGPGGDVAGIASLQVDVALLEGEAATVELPLGGQPCDDFVVSARDF